MIMRYAHPSEKHKADEVRQMEKGKAEAAQTIEIKVGTTFLDTIS